MKHQINAKEANINWEQGELRHDLTKLKKENNDMIDVLRDIIVYFELSTYPKEHPVLNVLIEKSKKIINF